jgi:hypothetical protein
MGLVATSEDEFLALQLVVPKLDAFLPARRLMAAVLAAR